MIHITKYLYFAFSLDLKIVLLSFKHPNYRQEIIKGNMPLYEFFNGKDDISSEPWKDYVSGKSTVQMAWINYKYYLKEKR